MSRFLTATGMDVSSDDTRQAVQELVTEGPYDWHEGVQLDVIFYGPVDDVWPFPGKTTANRDPRSWNSPAPACCSSTNGTDQRLEGHEVRSAATRDEPG